MIVIVILCVSELMLVVQANGYFMIGIVVKLGDLSRVHTDPGKVWKVMECKVEIFQVWKIMDNDHRYGKVIESVIGKLRCSLFQHLLLFLHFMSQRNKFFTILSPIGI